MGKTQGRNFQSLSSGVAKTCRNGALTTTGGNGSYLPHNEGVPDGSIASHCAFPKLTWDDSYVKTRSQNGGAMGVKTTL